MKHFFKSNRKLVFICALLLASITMTSCGAYIGLVSKTHNFQGKYAIDLDNSRSDILTIIEEVGKAMSLQVSELDVPQGLISLSTSSTGATYMLSGKAGSRSIKIKTFDSGRKLEIEIFVLGNFGAGQKEEADRVFNDFKMKLLEKVGKS